MSRLELSDTGMDVIIKMADGNPGAITAMMAIMEKHDEIDPQAVMGGGRCYYDSRHMGNLWY